MLENIWNCKSNSVPLSGQVWLQTILRESCLIGNDKNWCGSGASPRKGSPVVYTADDAATWLFHSTKLVS